MQRGLAVKYALIATVLLTALALSSCGTVEEWQIVPDNSCDLFSLLRDREEYRQPSPYDDPRLSEKYGQDPSLRSPYRDLFKSGAEFGCLFLQGEGKKSSGWKVFRTEAIKIQEDGSILWYDRNLLDYRQAKGWEFKKDELPKESVIISIYFLYPEQLQGQDHYQLCETLSKKRPRCFPDNALEKPDCWFYLTMSPQVGEGGESQFKFLQVSGDQKCKLCSREICKNKRDDDCDGLVDEGCEPNDCHHPNITVSCYTGNPSTAGIGICRTGEKTCVENKTSDKKKKARSPYVWTACKGQVTPKTEVCNGIDDDCDGETDENLSNCCLAGEVISDSCYPPPLAGKKLTSPCAPGKKYCQYRAGGGGKSGQCVGYIEPKKEVCNGVDDDCDGQIDENTEKEGKNCNTQLPAPCSDGTYKCRNGQLICKPNKPIEPEKCNGVDDDCDGQVDELFQEFGQKCKISGKVGPCAEGVVIGCTGGNVVCKEIFQKGVELCGDGIDNDCDGKTDEKDDECECNVGEEEECYPPKFQGQNLPKPCKKGKRVCLVTGKWGPCKGAVIPKKEVCNGIDDDCNGKVDDNIPSQKCTLSPSSANGLGPCQYGETICQNGALKCIAVHQKASDDTTCDGVDDDCDGQIDEDCNSVCSNNNNNPPPCYDFPKSWLQGKCKTKPGTLDCGSNSCNLGNAHSLPTKPHSTVTVVYEKCDGEDDDCDGKIDDNLEPGIENQPCTVKGKKGICRQGLTKCQNGTIVCNSLYSPNTKTEVCNGKDDDCDGQTDESDPHEGKECYDPIDSAGQKTLQGECAIGKFKCKNGTLICERNSPSNSVEKCNGKDDDCDGEVDEDLNAPECQTPNLPREGVCKGAKKICGGSAGWLSCSISSLYHSDNTFEVRETLCDNRDNDCDGRIDNRPNSSEPLRKPCEADLDGKKYPLSVLTRGICKVGYRECIGGSWSKCKGRQPPKERDCFNNLDNDCNGNIDKDEPPCKCRLDNWPYSRPWSTGKDGTIVVSGELLLDVTPGKDLKGPDGKPLARSEPFLTYHPITSLSPQGDRLTLKNVEGLSEGDELLLIVVQLKGSRDLKEVGNFRLVRISKVDKDNKNVTLKERVPSFSLLKSRLQKAKFLAVRVPNFKAVYIRPKSKLTVSPWNGETGGILALRTEFLRVEYSGKIDLSHRGFRGGKPTRKGKKGVGGESPAGFGSIWGGETKEKGEAIGGGGGGHLTPGKGGNSPLPQERSAGGKRYGLKVSRSQLFMGSGGGAGTTSSVMEDSPAGRGGRGGGMVLIVARTVSLAGEIDARGEDGADAKLQLVPAGGGGGGAGGSIAIFARQLIVYPSGKLTATGGKGGRGVGIKKSESGAKSPFYQEKSSRGGDGGTGVIFLSIQNYNGSAPKQSQIAKRTSPKPTVEKYPQMCTSP